MRTLSRTDTMTRSTLERQLLSAPDASQQSDRLLCPSRTAVGARVQPYVGEMKQIHKWVLSHVLEVCVRIQSPSKLGCRMAPLCRCWCNSVPNLCMYAICHPLARGGYDDYVQ